MNVKNAVTAAVTAALVASTARLLNGPNLFLKGAKLVSPSVTLIPPVHLTQTDYFLAHARELRDHLLHLLISLVNPFV